MTKYIARPCQFFIAYNLSVGQPPAASWRIVMMTSFKFLTEHVHYFNASIIQSFPSNLLKLHQLQGREGPVYTDNSILQIEDDISSIIPFFGQNVVIQWDSREGVLKYACSEHDPPCLD